MSSRTGETAENPRTVDEARDAVERSRQRISSTLDQLEGRIVDKKHELQEKADVLRPLRERIIEHPFTAVAVGAGVGMLLGVLGGGGNDDDEAVLLRAGARPRARSGRMSDEDRAELRQWRRSRRQRLHSISSHDRDDWGGGRSGRADHGRGDDDKRFDALKHQLMGAVTSAITAAVTARVRQFAQDNLSQLTGGGDGRSSRQEWRAEREEPRGGHH
jgi:ElaB/YqjD/DUF883 family membrane-anchored ribosome-binding protein